MDKASNAAQSAKESLSEVHFLFSCLNIILWNNHVFMRIRTQGGQQLKQKAQGATEAIKEKTGLGKWERTFLIRIYVFIPTILLLIIDRFIYLKPKIKDFKRSRLGNIFSGLSKIFNSNPRVVDFYLLINM